jgi:hypothetical protein
MVVGTVDRQLAVEPSVVTRNRRRMRANPLAGWELRIGDLRVYYDVLDDPEPLVQIVAVGIKERNNVRVGGEVIDL